MRPKGTTCDAVGSYRCSRGPMQALLTVVRECQEDLAIHFKHVYVCCIYTHTFFVSYTKMTGFLYSTYYDCMCIYIYDILS